MSTKNKKQAKKIESEIDLDQTSQEDNDLEESESEKSPDDIKKKHVQQAQREQSETTVYEDQNNIWFSEEQTAWFRQFIFQTIDMFNEQKSNAKKTVKKDPKKDLTEEQKEKQHQKQINYYHLNIKKIQNKLRSVIKSICTKTNINKQYVTCFSKENIDQIRSFVKQCQQDKDHQEDMDLTHYFEQVKEKYGCSNTPEFESIQLDHSLLC